VSKTWAVNGIELAVAAEGDGPLVVLAHGFPDLGLTWRHQVPALVGAGYRVVVPDMRGYGGSARPTEPAAYSAREIGLDLVGLLDVEGVERAHVVGHDWGASCVWPLGVDHPERLISLTGLSVPHVALAPAPPIEILRRRLGEDFYQVRFQVEGVAEEHLARDVTATLSAAFRDDFEAVGTGGGDGAPPVWMDRDEWSHFVATYEQTGFGGGLSYYRNIDENWRTASQRPDRRIEAPSLFVTGSTDPVARFMKVDATLFADLRVEVVEGAGHWVHREQPEAVTALLVEHLRRADDLVSRH
jgi:pimeloyl-ACP methyl ester carboxylesterase